MNKYFFIPLIGYIILLAAYINIDINFTYTWGQWIAESIIAILLWYFGYRANEE